MNIAKNELAAKDRIILQKDNLLAQRETLLAQKESTIEAMAKENAELRQRLGLNSTNSNFGIVTY